MPQQHQDNFEVLYVNSPWPVQRSDKDMCNSGMYEYEYNQNTYYGIVAAAGVFKYYHYKGYYNYHCVIDPDYSILPSGIKLCSWAIYPNFLCFTSHILFALLGIYTKQ